MNEGLQVRVTRHGGATHCRFDAVERFDNYLHRAPRQAMETMAAGTVLTLKRLVTSVIEPTAVTFRHPAPASIAEHLRILGPTVRFGQPEDSVVFPSAMALQHLARPGTSATDVAFLLGFSEPSAFTRAFRRWTGSPPTQFRSA